jgi:NADPH:quinone reductase-like Zn-dependent oxidoreductase
VTGVCSTENVELVRSLGADEVVDYKSDDFLRTSERYDVIVDNVGNRGLWSLRRVLAPTGVLVIVGRKAGRLAGGLGRKLRAKFFDRFVDQTLVALFAKVTQHDLAAVLELVRAGDVVPVIDRTYSLSDAPPRSATWRQDAPAARS